LSIGWILAILAAVLVAPGPAGATTASPFDYLPESSQISNTAVVSGTLSTSGGSAEAGTTVVLFAEPSEDAMDAMTDGSSLDLIPVSRAITDASGNWSLRVPSGFDFTRALSSDAVYYGRFKTVSPFYSMNLVAESFGDSGSDMYFFPTYAWVTGGGGTNAAMVSTTTDATDGPDGADDVNLGSATAAGSTISLAAQPATNVALSSASMPNGSCQVPCSADRCPITQVTTYKPVRTQLTVLQNAATSVYQTFTLTKGADITTGVGISASAGYGTFHQSGTKSTHTSATITFPTLTTNRAEALYTYEAYGKYRQDCYFNDSTGALHHYLLGYFTQRTKWAGGTDAGNGAFQVETWCTQYLPGSRHTMDYSRQTTLDKGVDLTSYLGLSLSSQTGFTSSTELVIDFHAKRNLCGANDYATGSPGRVAAEMILS
jgi:hypothetical protein